VSPWGRQAIIKKALLVASGAFLVYRLCRSRSCWIIPVGESGVSSKLDGFTAQENPAIPMIFNIASLYQDSDLGLNIINFTR
jgi:hypothetical protein